MIQTTIERGLSMTGQLSSNTVDIIREAAKSPLGILALVVILIATLAIRFFPPKKSSERVRVAIFGLIFAGVLLFGYNHFNVVEGSRYLSCQGYCPEPRRNANRRCKGMVVARW